MAERFSTRPEGPGYRFIQRYERGLPASQTDLAECISAYVEYLLKESGQEDSPPIDLKTILDRFSLEVVEGSLKESSLDIEGMNLASLGMIMVDDSDIHTRQRYTQAHELIENLILALEGNEYPSTLLPYIEGTKKERLCDWGAARLLMPLRWFHADVQRRGIGIESAEIIATRFDTSRLATLRHMVSCYPRRCGLVVWRRAHKPTEKRSRPALNQPSLWGGQVRGPEKKVRVHWTAFGRAARRYHVPRHQSISGESLIARALEDGELKRGRERVDLGDLKGTFEIEAAPFSAGGEPRVVSLFHWSREMFRGRDAQRAMFATA